MEPKQALKNFELGRLYGGADSGSDVVGDLFAWIYVMPAKRNHLRL